MSIKHPKQSLVLERPWDFFQQMGNGLWWTLIFPLKTVTVHVRQRSREPGIRWRMRDVRIKVQGSPCAWHFFSDRTRKLFKIYGIYVLLCQSEKHICIWSGGWISFQCLHQQHPCSQRRPWYFRGAFSLVERWQVGRSTCGLRTTTSAMCANLSTGTGKWSRLEQIASFKPLVMSNCLNLVCAITKRSRWDAWDQEAIQEKIDSGLIQLFTKQWGAKKPEDPVGEQHKWYPGGEEGTKLNTRWSSSFPCSVAVNI